MFSGGRGPGLENGLPGLVGDDHLAADPGVQLALEVVVAGLGELERVFVAGAVVGDVGAGVGVPLQVVGEIPVTECSRSGPSQSQVTFSPRLMWTSLFDQW